MSAPSQPYVHHDRASFSLDGELTVYTAAAVKSRLCGLLAEHTQVVLLDLSEVDECDTAGVQLLLSARRAVNAAGREFAVVDPSGPVREALILLGLHALIREAHGPGDGGTA